MFGLSKFLFRQTMPDDVPEDVRAALAAWRASPEPALDTFHFHTRYVVVDIASSGPDPEKDRLLGIAAVCLRQGTLHPDDAFYIDFSTLDGEGCTVDRQLTAFLQFVAKAPLVTYHVPYVGGFLQKACRERLGLDWQPRWLDMAWLLPALFDDKFHTAMPLDQWLEALGIGGGDADGRRDAMSNTLLLGRIFQMLLARAADKQIDSAAQLIEESRASSFLRRTH